MEISVEITWFLCDSSPRQIFYITRLGESFWAGTKNPHQANLASHHGVLHVMENYDWVESLPIWWNPHLDVEGSIRKASYISRRVNLSQEIFEQLFFDISREVAQFLWSYPLYSIRSVWKSTFFDFSKPCLLDSLSPLFLTILLFFLASYNFVVSWYIFTINVHGLHLPVNLGCKEQSLTVNLSHNHANILSVPKPYPPCGQVPYFLWSMNQ